jgi:hypothetical protein
VAASIARLSLRPLSWGRVFHLVNPRPVAYETVVELLHGLGCTLRRVPVDCWAAALEEAAEDGCSALLAPLQGLLRKLGTGAGGGAWAEPLRFQPPRFESGRTQTALAAVGASECPAVDRRLLEVYLAAFLERGLLGDGTAPRDRPLSAVTVPGRPAPPEVGPAEREPR